MSARLNPRVTGLESVFYYKIIETHQSEMHPTPVQQNSHPIILCGGYGGETAISPCLTVDKIGLRRSPAKNS